MAKSVKGSKAPKPNTRDIKACSCEKDKDGNPLAQRDFKASPFKGKACEKCLLIISFEQE